VPEHLRRSILVSLALGLFVAIALGLISDIRAVASSFGAFDWGMLPAVLGLTLFNYVLRWLKWDYYLRRMGMGDGVGYYDSALLFTSGMVMAVTPAKVGEVLKSALLKRINGTSIAASAPIVLAERITDGLAMLLLMGAGLTLYPPARPAFAALLVLTVAGLLLVQSQSLMQRALAMLARLPFAGKAVPRVTTAYESSRQLLCVAVTVRLDGYQRGVVVWRMRRDVLCADRSWDHRRGAVAESHVRLCRIDPVWSGVVSSRRSGGVGSLKHRVAGAARADGCRSGDDRNHHYSFLHPVVRRQSGSGCAGALRSALWHAACRSVACNVRRVKGAG
jgi:hypothetical protein